MQADEAAPDKVPRTDRGRRTLRLILDAAAVEFGARGFHETSITAITARAGVALGSFYTYFDTKDAVFRALVRDMSAQAGQVGVAAVAGAPSAVAGEAAVTAAFVTFARTHREIYRIIDEAEFVAPETYRAHYEAAATRIAARLRAGAQRGELRDDVGEVEAWALMGMNVFLGLRYGVLATDLPVATVAERVGALLAQGLRAPDRS